MIRIYEKKQWESEDILKRRNEVPDVSEEVSQIIKKVREGGDRAVFECERKRHPRPYLESLQVSDREFDEAFAALPGELLDTMKRAAANIEEFHKRQLCEGFSYERPDGSILGQRVMPIEKVGLYIPGGSASYPSSILMNAIPARIAGCSEIIMTSPSDKEGRMSPLILASAKLAGVTKLFKTGGAQAIAAMAYGTESIPKVYKITGPGNAYVAEAKRQVFGTVAIDMIAGPSEVLIISDGKSDPDLLAADLLSQAEHDKAATAVLITLSRAEAEAVRDRIEDRLKKLLREDIARVSVDSNGKILIAESIGEAAALSNELAPEHLEISTDDPFECLKLIKNAGSIFLGRETCEPLGDYFAGPNHTLPTMGTAKFSSALSVDDFVKRSQFLCYSSKAFRRDAEDIIRFAEAEGLTGHAESIRARL